MKEYQLLVEIIFKMVNGEEMHLIISQNIAISGASGKMGKAIIIASSERNDFIISAGSVSSHNKLLGLDLGELCGIRNLGKSLSSSLDTLFQDADVIIDFSSIENSLKVLEHASKKSIPVLIGTTGFNDKQFNQIKKFAEKIPVLYAPNTSMGISMLKNMIYSSYSFFSHFQLVSLEETHHIEKKDSPSGTAKYLAKNINLGLKENIKDSDIKSNRSGDIKGEHEIIFKNNNEEIKILHTVKDRSVFAEGAIDGAKWLSRQESGAYDMSDVYLFSS